jgi:hypothetical protein
MPDGSAMNGDLGTPMSAGSVFALDPGQSGLALRTHQEPRPGFIRIQTRDAMAKSVLGPQQGDFFAVGRSTRPTAPDQP